MATGEKILWLVAGAGIGTGATFLFGTRSGRRYRRQIGRKFEHGYEQINEATLDLMDRGKEFYERGKEFLEMTGDKVGRSLHVAHR